MAMQARQHAVQTHYALPHALLQSVPGQHAVCKHHPQAALASLLTRQNGVHGISACRSAQN